MPQKPKKSRARKTSTVPTLTYSYGCFQPTENLEPYLHQLLLAHRYQNVLTEIEKNRRAARLQMERAMNPRFDAACAVLDGLLARQAAARDEVSAQRQATRTRSVDGEVVEQVTALKPLLDAAYEERDEARAAMAKDPEIKAMWVAVIRAASTLCKAARTEAVAGGLYWGTGALVAKAAEQAAATPEGPSFHRWDGTGRVGVQLQKHNAQDACPATETEPARVAKKARPPHTTQTLFACTSRLLRIQPVPDGTFHLPRHRRRIASRTVAWIRIGSNPDRTPLWARVPIILHRPLPPDAEIKWAWILRRRVGIDYEYRLQFSLETATASPPAAAPGNGTVAINFGWRRAGDASLRVLYWQDTEGNGGEYLVPGTVDARIRHADSIRSTLDQNFDTVRMGLQTWLWQQRALPSWLKNVAPHLGQWKSQRRLAALIDHWKAAQDRPVGDDGVLVLLEAWAQRFRHLTRYEAHERDRAVNHRDEQYRLFAQRIARTYDTITIDTLKMPDVRAVAQPEQAAATDGRRQRRQADVAAPGGLREMLVAEAKRRAVRVALKETWMKTQRCHLCGCEERWDAAPAVQHTCTGCGVTWDQDYNNCRNLLTDPGSALDNRLAAE